MKDKNDASTVEYGLNLACFIVTLPIWLPFWLLGLLAKKIGIKP